MKLVDLALTALLVAAQFQFRLAYQSTAPAFLWTPHQDGFPSVMKEAVNYRILTPKDLASSIMSEGGWSNLLCSGKEAQDSVDLALLFVGSELQSVDVARSGKVDPELVDLLEVSLLKSNFSLAFPYVAVSKERDSIESSLISEFTHICGNDIGSSNIAFLGSCSFKGENLEKIADVHSVQDYLVTKMDKRSGQADLIVYCRGSSSQEKADTQQSEGQILSELLHLVEHLGAKYTALYVSGSSGSIQYPSHRELERFLAEVGDGSGNSTFCDGVCQIKSSLLEGILVGIVLLIILISGLCCMAGIDTPTRFESPPES